MTDTGLHIDHGAAARTEREPPTIVKRHRWPTRLWHWVNVVTLLVMLMSGLTIFNAHPRLY